MAKVFSTPQGQTYQKPNAGKIATGVVVATAASGVLNSVCGQINTDLANKMSAVSNNLPESTIEKIQQAAKDTLVRTGLDKKGVKIEYGAENMTSKLDSLRKKLHRLPNNEQLLDVLKGTDPKEQIKAGKNAFFNNTSNVVNMPNEKLSLNIFHELGHAANANLSKIGRILQKSRTPLVIIPSAISLIALFKTKKAPGEEPKGKVDKATTFIKNNAGKLTFLTFLPILIEEGMATLKGNGFAKKLLDPSLVKKVSKANAFGFATYLTLAVASSVGIFLGVKIKDEIASSKPIEQK